MAKLWPSPGKDEWMMLGANIRLHLSPGRVKVVMPMRNRYEYELCY